MASTHHHQVVVEEQGEGVPDRIDQMELLNASPVGAKEKPASSENLIEQTLSVKDEKLVPDNVSQDANNVDASRDTSSQLGPLDGSRDCSDINQTVVSAPQAQSALSGGYENATGEWEDYSRYINVESIEAGSTGVYNENPSVMFHTGYGYSPQLPPYGPYSPVTTPLPSGSRDNQLYSQQFPFPGPYYQQTPPPSMSYLTSATPMSQPDVTMPVEQGAFLGDSSNSHGMLFGPGPDYSLPYSPFGTENFGGSSGNPALYDLRQGFDGFGNNGFWSDWLNSPDGAGSLNPMPSPAASPQPVGGFRSFGQGIGPLSSGMVSQDQKPMYGFGSSLGSYDGGYFHGGVYHQGSNYGGSIHSLGTNGHSFLAVDKGRRRGKGGASLCNCNGALDFLNEQNRGPRATRPKKLIMEHSFPDDSKSGNSHARPVSELYNSPDFSTDYTDAKFFIIKSYSEDNVHKSIKYGVWASTANGNRKLDSAYHEAKEKGHSCPVFLFFSVNASAQFCGVAEMIGPVNFEKNVDFWQQDKWSGQFPVKWHIIKDAPNSLFRHIILENNDNKPVTNSRDTQEKICR
ncbi:uncharacterized protein LOC109841419 isoform X2 [Asparagus officinalis]|uniref:uncharacterized protein LOC109841419 isoform X2 n=1 Tax=Asparagus officinalis TaxID=4686 RepID=UPI00098E0858|nr:uncharacterized protein LOC109841419 isoform X2 [Asparagus officinalis]